MKNNFILDAERNIGIHVFYTPQIGLGGRLRTVTRDFIVKEISNFPAKKQDGKFIIAEIKASNWETNLLIRELSKRLQISRKRIGFAGTKDKRAETSQLMSFYNIKKKDLSKLKINKVKIKNIYSSDRQVKIGDLLGNDFIITIRNVKENTSLKKVKDISNSIIDVGGFPNFYGIQRFGIIRPITHIVGKHIVNNDFKKAVMTYIANPIEGENQDSFLARKELEKTQDYTEALKNYPPDLNFEKAILNKLINDSDDYINALKELPQNLLSMFVYAYQSYIFNNILSERIRKNFPLEQAVLGDIILPIKKGLIEKKGIEVKENNIDKINKQISRGKAVVSGLLIGADTKFSKGLMGEIEYKIVEKERIDPRDFIIPEIPSISSYGSRRALLANITNLNYDLIDDKLNKGKLALILKFKLLKGCYATSLLREFMKTDNIRNY